MGTENPNMRQIPHIYVFKNSIFKLINGPHYMILHERDSVGWFQNLARMYTCLKLVKFKKRGTEPQPQLSLTDSCARRKFWAKTTK